MNDNVETNGERLCRSLPNTMNSQKTAMAIKKEYSKDKTVCRVTFTLPVEVGKQFAEVALVGNFNNWNPKTNLFGLKKNGEYSVGLDLEPNREYQFRYLGNGEVWFNESGAEKSVPTPYGDCQNSIIVA